MGAQGPLPDPKRRRKEWEPRVPGPRGWGAARSSAAAARGAGRCRALRLEVSVPGADRKSRPRAAPVPAAACPRCGSLPGPPAGGVRSRRGPEGRPRAAPVPAAVCPRCGSLSCPPAEVQVGGSPRAAPVTVTACPRCGTGPGPPAGGVRSRRGPEGRPRAAPVPAAVCPRCGSLSIPPREVQLVTVRGRRPSLSRPARGAGQAGPSDRRCPRFSGDRQVRVTGKWPHFVVVVES